MDTSALLAFDGPGCQVDRLVLAADGVRQLADDVHDGARRIPKRLVRAASPSFTAVEGEIGTDLAVHLHARLRWGAEELVDYCAFLQHSPVYMGGGDVCGEAQLRLSKAHPPDMDKAVLVLVPEVVDRSEVAAVEPLVPLWIGLQRLDECAWTGANPSDFVHPRVVGPGAVFSAPLKVGFAGVDGERRPLQGFADPVNREPVDGLVERRPKVVDDLPENDRPLNRDGAVESKPVEVLGSLVVHLWGKTPWLALLPCEHFAVERAEVLIRPRDLPLDAQEGTWIDFQDALLEPDTAILSPNGR